MATNRKKIIAFCSLAFLYGSAFGMQWLSNVCYPYDKLSNYSSSGHYDRVITGTFKEPEVQGFLREFQPPQEVLSSLITADRKKQREAVAKTDEGDVFILKYKDPISRVVCARRMQKMVERKAYTTVSVPEKYLFLSHDGKHLVCAAKKIIPIQEEKITIDLKQATEFLDIALKTGFRDFHQNNFMIDENKKIVFIDTESRSFFTKEFHDRSVGCCVFSTYHFLVKDTDNVNRRDRMSGIDFTLTEEASQYLQNKKDKDLHNPDICDYILEKTEYDSTHLNLSKVLPLLASKVLPS